MLSDYLNKKMIILLKWEDNIDSELVYQYQSLLDIINNLIKEYENYDNFKKVVKLIEIYRMFLDSNLCIK